MPTEYKLVEVLPNGLRLLRGSIEGTERAWERLHELAKHTTNELVALHPETGEVVAQMNVTLGKERARRRLFQIAYTEILGRERAKCLRIRGYGITTVLGNESARAVLAHSEEEYELFIIGHRAPEQARAEMVVWLREKYPKAKILALNPDLRELTGTDFNVPLNGPETWVPLIGRALA